MIGRLINCMLVGMLIPADQPSPSPSSSLHEPNSTLSLSVTQVALSTSVEDYQIRLPSGVMQTIERVSYKGVL